MRNLHVAWNVLRETKDENRCVYAKKTLERASLARSGYVDVFSHMPTKKRRRTHEALARVTAERLEELRRERGLTVEEFARACGATRHTTYLAWRNGVSVPGGHYLRTMAEKFDVSTDWLLGIASARRPAEPLLTDAEIDRAVEARLRRELRKREAAGTLGKGTSIQWEGDLPWPINGAKILADATEREAELIKGTMRELFVDRYHAASGEGRNPGHLKISAWPTDDAGIRALLGVLASLNQTTRNLWRLGLLQRPRLPKELRLMQQQLRAARRKTELVSATKSRARKRKS